MVNLEVMKTEPYNGEIYWPTYAICSLNIYLVHVWGPIKYCPPYSARVGSKYYSPSALWSQNITHLVHVLGPNITHLVHVWSPIIAHLVHVWGPNIANLVHEWGPNIAHLVHVWCANIAHLVQYLERNTGSPNK